MDVGKTGPSREVSVEKTCESLRFVRNMTRGLKNDQSSCDGQYYNFNRTLVILFPRVLREKKNIFAVRSPISARLQDFRKNQPR